MAGLYIHIPYCHSKCSYCDFCSTSKVDTAEDYITALIDEYRLRKDEVNEPLSTVYIGGGTPSILPMPTLSRLVESLGHPVLEEFTIEANPEDVTPEWAFLEQSKPDLPGKQKCVQWALLNPLLLTRHL